MDKNVEKSKQIEKMLNSVNATYRRFSAIDGHLILKNNKTYFEDKQAKNTLNYGTKKLSAGQIGCWLSYLSLMKEIAESGRNKPVLVLEDDVDLEVDFMSTLSSTLKLLPAQWDILLCGYCCLTKLNPKYSRVKHVYPVKKFATTHCQVFRNSTTARKVYEKLNVNFNVSSIDKPVDMMLHDLTLTRQFKVFALKHPIAIQRRDIFKSDIENSWPIGNVRLRNSLKSSIKNL